MDQKRLNTIRQQIDDIDSNIIKAFEKRMVLVDEVANYKIDSGKNVHDAAREQRVIEKAQSRVEADFVREYVPSLYRSIMDISKQRQRALINEKMSKSHYNAPMQDNCKVGYLGPLGSFSHQAMIDCFDTNDGIGHNNFGEIIDAVANGTLDYGIVPIENTSTGDVNLVIDLLPDSDVYIINEYILKVRHCLLGHKDATVDDITMVHSHPQALGQCKEFLDAHGIHSSLAKSTAQGAYMVNENDDIQEGAVASAHCADEYNLKILASDINTNTYNYTRFAIIAKKLKVADDANKTSLIIEISHQSGSLFGLLSLFADRKLNLLKLVSRPIPNNPWLYKFYMDFSGNITENDTKEILDDMAKFGAKVRILGCYHAHEVR